MPRKLRKCIFANSEPFNSPQDDDPKPQIHLEDQNTSPNVSDKKVEKASPAPVQPTSEQLMIAQIIGGGDEDAKQQHLKIQQVMDITGKEEDEVATALFDAGWEQNRAVELLLEGGSSQGAWEETGSKKNKKKQKQAAEEKV